MKISIHCLLEYETSRSKVEEVDVEINLKVKELQKRIEALEEERERKTFFYKKEMNLLESDSKFQKLNKKFNDLCIHLRIKNKGNFISLLRRNLTNGKFFYYNTDNPLHSKNMMEMTDEQWKVKKQAFTKINLVTLEIVKSRQDKIKMILKS